MYGLEVVPAVPKMIYRQERSLLELGETFETVAEGLRRVLLEASAHHEYSGKVKLHALRAAKNYMEGKPHHSKLSQKNNWMSYFESGFDKGN